jgi:choline monooxygenase
MLNLDSSFYHDPAIYAAERRCIFAPSWQLVTHESTLPNPGDYFTTRVAGTSVFVIRGEDNELRGFKNVCRHRGAKLLSDGVGHCSGLRCPYHDWHYDDRGRLIDTPWFGEPSPFELGRWPLFPVRVQSWRKLVFVALAPKVALEEQLGDLPDELAEADLEKFSSMAARRFDVAVNWKTYIDQFVENYHVPRIHSPDKSAAIETFSSTPRRGMMIITAPTARTYGSKWLWGWPNWTLSLFAGGMKTSRVNPASAQSLEVYFDFYFADGSDSALPLRSRVIGATESIFREDIKACELVQSNYASGDCSPGPLHPQLERSVEYFQCRVRDALQADRQ